MDESDIVPEARMTTVSMLSEEEDHSDSDVSDESSQQEFHPVDASQSGESSFSSAEEDPIDIELESLLMNEGY